MMRLWRADEVGECGLLDGLVFGGESFVVLALVFVPAGDVELLDEQVRVLPDAVQIPSDGSGAEPGASHGLHRGDEGSLLIGVNLIADRHGDRAGTVGSDGEPWGVPIGQRGTVEVLAVGDPKNDDHQGAEPEQGGDQPPEWSGDGLGAEEHHEQDAEGPCSYPAGHEQLDLGGDRGNGGRPAESAYD